MGAPRGQMAFVSLTALACLSAAVMCACPGARDGGRIASAGCVKDGDCGEGRVCSAGQCREPHVFADPVTRGADPTGAGRTAGSPPFAMYRGDAQHRGRLAGAAARKAPKQLWSLATGGPIVGSPTIGPDGTIY